MKSEHPITDVANATIELFKALRALDDTGMVSTLEVEKTIDMIALDVSSLLIKFGVSVEAQKKL